MNTIQQLIVDTHAHMGDPLFDEDLDQVLERARNAGIEYVISVGENYKEALKNLKLSDQHKQIQPAIGLYPSNPDFELAENIHTLILQEKDKIAAIGEVGLDFRITQDDTEHKIQKEIFASFIDLSLQCNLPLNVHSRSAGRHAVNMLLEGGARLVQLHAFDGKTGSAWPAVEAGYFFSIPPSVTRSRQKQKLVKNLPLSCLLVETDSPVLGPQHEIRNEPANARLVIQAISDIKNVNSHEVLQWVQANTKRLYRNLFPED